MLRNAHSPHEAGTAERRIGIDPGRLGYILGRNAGDLLDGLEVVLIDDLPPLVELLGAVADEFGVSQSLVENDLRHTVVERHVGPWPRSQPEVGEVAHLDPARVDDDQLRPSFDNGAAHS